MISLSNVKFAIQAEQSSKSIAGILKFKESKVQISNSNFSSHLLISHDKRVLSFLQLVGKTIYLMTQLVVNK